MMTLLADLVGVREVRSLIALYAVAAVLEGVTLALLIPFLRAFLDDSGAGAGGWLVALCATGVAFLVLQSAAMVRSYRISVYDVCDALIVRIADRVLELPLGWFTAEREARIASAVSREINTLSHIASIVLPNIISALGVPAVMLIAVALVDWTLAAVMLIAVLPLAWIWARMRRAATEASEIETAAATGAAGRLIEYARLQPVLRATGLTRRGWASLDDALAEEDVAVRRALTVKGRPAMGFTLVLYATFAALIALGLAHVLDRRLDAVAYLAVMVITARMLGPLTQAVLFSSEIHNAAVALRAIHSIVFAEPLPEPEPAEAREPAGTEVAFSGVRFGYDPAAPVLDGVDFTAPAGTMTALVGPSGSGKSTILRLIGRFWDVDAGAVTVGGVDVREIPTRRLMELTSMVFQDVYLFDTTIRENVRLARPGATDAELDAAARAARLDQVIEALPDGWDTQVGQGGLKLSGGERQRVSIARAFVKDAPILLLDEITSALDGENEAAITSVMRELTRGRTVFLVAHRLSTVRDADQILVLQPDPSGAARIAERGTPAGLIAAGGRYAEFAEASSAAGRWRFGE
ncbi:ABC transporter ATP-binding protein [Corynebacterium sphenisci DSM 44792]|uniref:ABC transporter ATP-binding protein n=1 Tax=Corynebacterium sphenisci DSM 44792 TaxID=1437874 RepID=A0A1L7CZ38_9CORY|nr:ABC transporter ATP-binding protein [Corynebacterium sphenisci]APT91100.1 ABC transporter ATP-binding protein [Corynebacterium sphenisci DSM 44792]